MIHITLWNSCFPGSSRAELSFSTQLDIDCFFQKIVLQYEKNIPNILECHHAAWVEITIFVCINYQPLTVSVFANMVLRQSYSNFLILPFPSI